VRTVLMRRSLLLQLAMLRRIFPTKVPGTKQKTLRDFDDDACLQQFRFKKEHIVELLEILHMTNRSGEPLPLRVGREGHTSVLPADAALLILLARFSWPRRFYDLSLLLGTTKTVAQEAFAYMLHEIHDKFGYLVADAATYLQDDVYVTENCNIMASQSQLLSNIVGYIDTKFVQTTRPGGEGCVMQSVDQRDVYTGAKKCHGLKFQVLVCANGLAMTEKARAGPRGDATILGESRWLVYLQRVSAQIGFDAAVIGDGAYARSRNLVRRNTDRDLQRIPRRLSDLLNQYRVLVENAFASIVNQWKTVACKSNFVYGTTPFDQVWQVVLLLQNLRTLKYGNQVTAALGYNLNITWRQYLQ